MRIDQNPERLQFVDALRRTFETYPHKAPPVPVFHPQLGTFATVENGALWRDPKVLTDSQYQALIKDENDLVALSRKRKRRFLRNLARGMHARLFAEQPDLASALIAQMPAAAYALKCTSFDNIISQRANGYDRDQIFIKLSQTTVASNWSSFVRSGGNPGAVSFNSIPGGSVLNAATTNALPLGNPGSGNKKFLTNIGVNHTTGVNVVQLVDVLVAAGGITTNSTSAQTINTSALTRFTGTAAAGNMITLEVTTAPGATAQNVTVGYTDQTGTAQTTVATAMTASAAAFRLVPVAGGAAIPLNDGVTGVRSVETVTFSAANATGVLALYIYRPVVFVPTVINSTWVERTTPSALSGIRELPVGSDSECGCLQPFVLASSTSTGAQTYYLYITDES